MIKIFECLHPPDAESLAAHLRRRGINAVVLGQHTFALPGANPAAGISVWIVNNEDLSAARRQLKLFEEERWAQTRQAQQAGRPWRCRTCGAEVDGVFALCWNCGAPHPEER